MQRFNVVYEKLYKNQIMNIDKALERLEWRFKSSWKVNENDIEAFNAILKFKEQSESKNLLENENFAKLWIHQLILLSETEMYTGERSMQVIDEILNRSVFDWCLILQTKLGLMRFNSISNGNVSNEKDDALKHPENNKQETKELIGEKSKEMHEALLHQPKQEDIIKFVNIEITKAINKFEK